MAGIYGERTGYLIFSAHNILKIFDHKKAGGSCLGIPTKEIMKNCLFLQSCRNKNAKNFTQKIVLKCDVL